MSSCSNTDFLKLFFSSSLLHFKNRDTFWIMASAWTGETAMRPGRGGWGKTEWGRGCAHGEVRHPDKLPHLTGRLRTRDDNNHGWLGGWEVAAQLRALLWPGAPAPHFIALCTSQNLADTFPLLVLLEPQPLNFFLFTFTPSWLSSPPFLSSQ